MVDLTSACASSFSEGKKISMKVYHNLKSVIKKKYGQDSINISDEGGFTPNIQENKKGLELLKITIEKASYTDKVVISMDVTASKFYDKKNKKYNLNFKEDNNDNSAKFLGDELIKVYDVFMNEYPIILIEDSFDQDDWKHYAKFTASLGTDHR